MKALHLALAAALVLPAAGCVVHGHGGRVSAGVGVGVGHVHHYSFYPDYDAYHCGGCGFWWAIDGGAWVEFRTRPSHIQLSPALVVIDVDDGPEPWVHVERHRASVPPGHRKADHPGKGPPPGKGWKKDKD